MDLKLQGKTVFISGSTAGIGLAVAQSMLGEGASVIVNGRTQASVDKAIRSLKASFPDADISGVPIDFGDIETLSAALGQLRGVDILINNVGIYKAEPFFEMSDADWQHQFEINVMSGVRLSRALLPGMLEKDWGRIVFVSSECALLVPPDMLAYSMTKTAMLAVSRGLAEMTQGTGVTVNAVLPGSTLSEGAERFLEEEAQRSGTDVQQVTQDFFTNVRPTSLLQRFAAVDEVAHTITYLSSPLAAATNGAAIKIDGGSTGGIV
ncbi:SDR family NAD(P)-dependent oxidoreductase [Flagellimonas sp. DF-77]|uniref:SDR family NAD(P)-dependent oxidoreductase n=1 Tax=Flagellimonas algarum TaxID=3230298 RepID=UPI003396F9C2